MALKGYGETLKEDRDVLKGDGMYQRVMEKALVDEGEALEGDGRS